MRPSWYEVVEDDSLEQGDILLNVPIVKLPDEFALELRSLQSEIELEAEFEIIDAIIMTQTCDLVQDKTRFVTICRAVELAKHPEFPQETNKDFANLNALRTGRLIHFHLLDQCAIADYEKDFWIVEFESIYSLPIGFVKNHILRAGKRLRLKSPYKEHLSQAFARVFMRVGLPSDIPPFEKPKG